jgi:hypothetical protein
MALRFQPYALRLLSASPLAHAVPGVKPFYANLPARPFVLKRTLATGRFPG